MKAILILRNIRVENANAIAGMTYGFPAISSFLGFTHALSRSLQQDHGLQLGGCAVISHWQQLGAYQPSGWGDFIFAQTRNPLTKEATTQPFIEEGRMHMEVSLLIECDFTANDLEFGTDDIQGDIALFESYVLNKVLAQRLAGGTILGLRRRQAVKFVEVPEEYEAIEKFRRTLTRQLLPGFVLVDRLDLLHAHFQQLRASQPEAELVDAWLDFVALKHAAPETPAGQEPEDTKRKLVWQRQAKPASGWLVPISAGFQAISPLYPAGQVANVRDKQSPFRFVETAYSIGQWLSPHRLSDLEHMFWRYQLDGDLYWCRNGYVADKQSSEDTAMQDSTL